MREKGAKPDGLVAQIAGRQHGVVTTQQIEACGIDGDGIRWRVSTGRLHRLHRGVYAVGHAAVPFEGRCLAAVMALDPHAMDAEAVLNAVMGHRSAAELWGFMQRAIGPIHVTLAADGGRRKREGLIIHRSRTLVPESTAFIAGVRATTPARTIADLRRGLGKDLHQRATRRALDLRLVSLEQLGPDPDLTRSELERTFRGICRRHRLPQPEVNARVGPYEVDFLWSTKSLIVETDSWQFHGDRAAFERDRERDQQLQAKGYRVVRVSYRQLRDSRADIVGALRALLTN